VVNRRKLVPNPDKNHLKHRKIKGNDKEEMHQNNSIKSSDDQNRNIFAENNIKNTILD